MTNTTTIDTKELAKFAQLSEQWWDFDGPLKTLHDINPVRLGFLKHYVDLSTCDVLDVGCGGGIFSEGMARLGAQVTGLDAEPDAINAAQLHAKRTNLNIDYICKPIERYEEKQFSVITCMEMLEHVVHPQRVIEHCARLLKPDGILFLSTINRTLTAFATAVIGAEYVLQLLPRQTHDYAKFIKPSELAQMARDSRLQTLGLKGMTYNPLTRTASLTSSVSVNYLLACKKG